MTRTLSSTAMAKTRRLSELLHLFALSIWFGTVLMTGLTAGVLFPTIRSLEPTTPLFAGYPEDHWVIIAGHVAARLFMVCDAIQMGCGAIALLTFGIVLSKLRKGASRPIAALVRSIVLTVAFLLLSFQIFVLGPRMQVSLRGFWDNAQAAKVEDAERYRAAFDKDHPIASSVLGATAVAVMAAWFCGAFGLATSGGCDGKGGCGCGPACQCLARSRAPEVPA